MYNNLATGRKSGIGPSGVAMVDSSNEVIENGVLIYADQLNTDKIWLGEQGLTADSADSTDGFPLSSGDSLFLPIRQITEIYVTSGTDSNQKVWWVLV